MTDPLTVSNLKKSYKAKKEVVHALNGVSFSVKKGEIFGLLGPNGAGKTTTINILTGILSSDSGKVLFFGKEPCEETQNRINAATAYNALNGIITVRQNLNVYAKIYNVKNAKKKIDDLLKIMKIDHLQNRKVWDLSSGQKTRVNLCKAFINSPDLVFLDEATAGLDPDIAHRVREVIREMKTTVIFTSHIMSEVEQLCDRIAFLSKGKILKIDTPDKLKKLIKRDILIIEFLSKPKGWQKILAQFEVLSTKNEKIAVRIKTPKETHNLIHTLITSGFEIRDFHVKKPTLDEVFIKIARGEL